MQQHQACLQQSCRLANNHHILVTACSNDIPDQVGCPVLTCSTVTTRFILRDAWLVLETGAWITIYMYTIVHALFFVE